MIVAGLQRLLLRHRRSVVKLVHAALFVAAYFAATAIRFDFAIPPENWTLFTNSLLFVVVVKLVCFSLAGSFHGWMRYVTFHDLITLLRASTVSSLAVIVADHFLTPRESIPRSIVLLDFLLTVLMIGSVRSIGRLGREQLLPFLRMRFIKEAGFRPALLVGASPLGIQIARQIHARPSLKTRIVGLLDSDDLLHGRRLGGILVLGAPANIAAHAEAWNAKDVYMAGGALSGRSLRELVDRCREAGLKLKVVPQLDDFLDGSAVGPAGLRLRDLDINDLLRREPVKLDESSVNDFIRGRVVAVTGAGGSIGSEICRQLLSYEPRALILVERAENNLFQIDRELERCRGATVVIPFIGDVTDEPRMRLLFEQFRPEVLFHAAAHKHVPMMEANPGEAIKNNSLGTKLVADLAHEFQLQGFVLISTDKAVNPTSVMGVSKQLAERYVHALSQFSTTRFVAVRFGNVLGSVGSVIPVFQEQIRAGGPITITHPDMRRFFMTIPEASQLVIQAGAMGKRGEIFVLDMGEPIKIIDLARDLIRLSGLSPHDVDIEFTGIRPGEKLYEELYFDEEQTLPTFHPKLRVAYHRPFDFAEVGQMFEELAHLACESDAVHIVRRLKHYVPEYAATPSTSVESANASVVASAAAFPTALPTIVK